MSKRFGRNQRRKAREEILRLSTDNKKLISQLANLDQRFQYVEKSLSSQFGSPSVFLPPGRTWVDYAASRQPYSNITTPITKPKFSPGDGTPSKVIPKNVQLDSFVTQLSLANRMLHLQVSFQSKCWGYSLTDEVVANSTPELLRHLLSSNLVPHIVADLKTTTQA